MGISSQRAGRVRDFSKVGRAVSMTTTSTDTDRFRVYCANPPCSKFLHPTLHVQDPDTEITYAICESEECNRLTCITCKTLLDHGTQNHFCRQDEDDRKFKATAKEKGYQECFVCGTTVELAEACNHMT